ncbi:hypothetical protein [uncultured Bacteroides sp.]|uniref:hypothetical protein n=1 Tax=uncultured Bacteroides sp. TaxID=162156 RepID=UPI002AAAED76|nr:hypothetical protein [uncultured Bacteroides sp.]
MNNVKNDLKNIAWEFAQIIPEYNGDRVRKDACGAWIVYDDFNNKDSIFGWEIDHIYPISRLQQLNVPADLWDHPLNLRALHWKNKFSKGNSYPRYTSMVIEEGATNMEQRIVFWISEPLQYELRKLFGLSE